MHPIKSYGKSSRKGKSYSSVVVVNWSTATHISASGLCLPCQRTLAELDLEAHFLAPKETQSPSKKDSFTRTQTLLCKWGWYKAYFMHHYLGLISHNGNWSLILTISGKDLPLLQKRDNHPVRVSVLGTTRQKRPEPLQGLLSNCFGSCCLRDTTVQGWREGKPSFPQQVGRSPWTAGCRAVRHLWTQTRQAQEPLWAGAVALLAA